MLFCQGIGLLVLKVRACSNTHMFNNEVSVFCFHLLMSASE